MKVLFVFREGIESNYILSKVLKSQKNSVVIFETGKTARQQKLRRIFKGIPFYIYPTKLVDLVSLFIYTKLEESYIERRVTSVKVKPTLIVDDINEPQCVEIINNENPDLILIFGTAIVRSQFFQKVRIPMFNIHTGILPEYRNVHSEFWAWVHKDYKKIGSTIIYLDKGIDTGAIAAQNFVKHLSTDSLFGVKYKNVSGIPPMIDSFLKQYKQKMLKKTKQKSEDAGFYKTPTTIDFLKLLSTW